MTEEHRLYKSKGYIKTNLDLHSVVLNISRVKHIKLVQKKNYMMLDLNIKNTSLFSLKRKKKNYLYSATKIVESEYSFSNYFFLFKDYV